MGNDRSVRSPAQPARGLAPLQADKIPHWDWDVLGEARQ